MPKDEWANERQKINARKWHPKSQYVQRTSKPKRRKPVERKGSFGFSLGTVLWFGRWQGYTVRTVPIDYMLWLGEQPNTGKSEYIERFKEWIRNGNYRYKIDHQHLEHPPMRKKRKRAVREARREVVCGDQDRQRTAANEADAFF